MSSGCQAPDLAATTWAPHSAPGALPLAVGQAGDTCCAFCGTCCPDGGARPPGFCRGWHVPGTTNSPIFHAACGQCL